jgi:hypothetical protein
VPISLKIRLRKRNSILALQPHTKHLSFYTAVAIAKSCTRIEAVLDKKNSFSNILDCCIDNFTKKGCARGTKYWPYNPIPNICCFIRQSQSQNVALALEPF